MSPSEYQELVQFLGERFAAIDRRFDGVERRLDAVERRFIGVDQRFDAMEERSDRQLQELRAEILGHFDELYRKIERLEQEYLAITQALRRIEAMLTDERARREILERDVGALKEHVAVLRARVDEIERRLGTA